MKKGIVISAVVASLTLTTSLYAKNKKHKAQNFKQEKKIARQTIKKLVKNFQTNFKQAIKTEGPAGAVNFCSSKADEITASVNKKLKNGVSIKRITLNPRNEKNLAQNEEAKILSSLKTLKENGVVLPKLLVQKIDKKHTKVIKPIMIKPKCLICHGEKDKLNPKAYETIKAKYPNDKATGYKLGELRGAFVVDIVKK